MSLTLQVSNMFSETPKGRGVLQNVKGAKDLMNGLGLQHQAAKIWTCKLVPAHAIERSFCIHTLMIRAVRHARASQHARCPAGPSYQGQSPALQLGAKGNILALKGDSGTMVSVFCSLLAHEGCCRLTRSFDRIVSQGSRSCELLARFLRKAKYTSVRSGQITGLSGTDLDEQ